MRIKINVGLDHTFKQESYQVVKIVTTECLLSGISKVVYGFIDDTNNVRNIPEEFVEVIE